MRVAVEHLGDRFVGRVVTLERTDNPKSISLSAGLDRLLLWLGETSLLRRLAYTSAEIQAGTGCKEAFEPVAVDRELMQGVKFINPPKEHISPEEEIRSILYKLV